MPALQSLSVHQWQWVALYTEDPLGWGGVVDKGERDVSVPETMGINLANSAGNSYYTEFIVLPNNAQCLVWIWVAVAWRSTLYMCISRHMLPNRSHQHMYSCILKVVPGFSRFADGAFIVNLYTHFTSDIQMSSQEDHMSCRIGLGVSQVSRKRLVCKFKRKEKDPTPTIHAIQRCKV